MSLSEADSPTALDQLRSRLPRPLRRKLHRARDLAPPRADDHRPTAIAALDRLLPGGLPRGQLVELIGRRSSGRFSLLLSVLATVTGTGDCAALVDLGDGFDARAAADAGVRLERLLWLRPRRMRKALAGAEIVLGCGFPLIVFDLGMPPVPGGRGAEPAWLRLARGAARQGSSVLVSSPYRTSGTAASAVLETGERTPLWDDRGRHLLTGLSGRLRIRKLRGAIPGDVAQGFRFHVSEATAAGLFAAPLPEPSGDEAAPRPARAAAGGRR